MNQFFESAIKSATNATSIKSQEVIQKLWSDYGEIIRTNLVNGDVPSVVVKHVKVSLRNQHPKGWSTNKGHERKIKSYQVEYEWYNNYEKECDYHIKLPRCFALATLQDETLFVLEDLDAAGFMARKTEVSQKEMQACLKWLAYFHARFLHQTPERLWETGTYWHLATREEEYEVLDDLSLKQAAEKIDNTLNNCAYQTLVHGDAKLANFCFNSLGDEVAAVDFQYVGGGCGMKDVAYFVGSCFNEDECKELEGTILNYYFKELKTALKIYKPQIAFEALQQEWEKMYYYAWADFHRFLKGWSPGHWKINSYSEEVVKTVIKDIRQ